MCHLHKNGNLKRDETRVLSGVAYMTKRRGPRTEPWGHHRGFDQRISWEEILLMLLTRKQRGDR